MQTNKRGKTGFIFLRRRPKSCAMCWLIICAANRGSSAVAGQMRLDIDGLEIAGTTADEKVLLIDEAIEQFRLEHSDKARVVVLKFFGGLTDREVAAELGVTDRTIERHWAYAKAWLFRYIREQG